MMGFVLMPLRGSIPFNEMYNVAIIGMDKDHMATFASIRAELLLALGIGP